MRALSLLFLSQPCLGWGRGEAGPRQATAGAGAPRRLPRVGVLSPPRLWLAVENSNRCTRSHSLLIPDGPLGPGGPQARHTDQRSAGTWRRRPPAHPTGSRCSLFNPRLRKGH